MLIRAADRVDDRSPHPSVSGTPSAACLVRPDLVSARASNNNSRHALEASALIAKVAADGDEPWGAKISVVPANR
jgi:hypothetical protein